jgi:hypothetical protein
MTAPMAGQNAAKAPKMSSNSASAAATMSHISSGDMVVKVYWLEKLVCGDMVLPKIGKL